jgi:hypothetical protein
MAKQKALGKSRNFTVKVEFSDSDESIQYSMPEDLLLPISTDNRIKKAVKEIIKQRRDRSDWGAQFQPAATSREEYINNVINQPLYFQRLVAPLPNNADNPNLCSFMNVGGLLNKGVCWWHSRFQRASLYLAFYLPDKPKPSKKDASKMIWSLMRADKVVEIPGFSNFSEFSTAYQSEIQHCLDSTQILEGVFMFSWIDGLAGKDEVEPREMQRLMDKIYFEVTTNGLAYVKIQMPGISSHSWIMTEMEPDGEPNDIGQGYNYRFIDSNFPMKAIEYNYTPPKTQLPLPTIFPKNFVGVPYLERTWELDKIKNVIDDYIFKWRGKKGHKRSECP